MVTERYFPIWGGAENQLRELVRLLGKHNHNVDVVTRRWKTSMPRIESIEGATVHRIGIPGESLLALFVFILALFTYLIRNRHKFDVVHSHGAVKMAALLAVAEVFTGVPVVAKIATAGHIPSLQNHIFGKFILALLKRVDVLVCISSEIRAELQEIHIPDEKIRYIENGVNTTRFKPFNEELRTTWRFERALPEDAVLVLFAGRLVRRKGIDILIDAWKVVEKADARAHLYLLGSGDYQPDSIELELQKSVATCGLRRIYFEGNVPAPENYLNVADLFAFPSHKEGFPNAVLEAMAAGLPVVASRIGGNEDLIIHNSTGLLYQVDNSNELAECLIKLITDPRIRSRLGIQARCHVLTYNSITRIASLYSTLYSELYSDCNAR